MQDVAPLSVFEKASPCDVEAERAVIGSILLDKDCIFEVASILREDDFFRLAHRRMYSAILDLHKGDRGTDLVTLFDELQCRGHLDEEEDGGSAELTRSYVGDLFEEAFTSANAEHYSRIVKRKSILRALILHGMSVIHMAHNPAAHAEEILSEAHQKLSDLGVDNMPQQAESVADTIRTVFDTLQARESGSGSRCVLTGFSDLDDATGGLHCGELIFIAARPSIGKTTLAINIAQRAAIPGGPAILICSLEQSRHELAERMLCAESSVSSHRLRTNRLQQPDIAKLMDASPVIGAKPIFIDDTPAASVFQIGLAARRIKARRGLAAIVIDYLQLVTPDHDDRRHNREVQVAGMSRGLKSLARQLDVPVIVLAQLNREMEKSTDKRPRLHHLRESGAIEQDADVVILLSRDTTDDSVVLLDIAKQRNGKTGLLKLLLMKEYLRFEQISNLPENDRFQERSDFQ